MLKRLIHCRPTGLQPTVKKQQCWLQLNIVGLIRKHRCFVHFSDSVIDVGLVVSMGAAG